MSLQSVHDNKHATQLSRNEKNPTGTRLTGNEQHGTRLSTNERSAARKSMSERNTTRRSMEGRNNTQLTMNEKHATRLSTNTKLATKLGVDESHSTRLSNDGRLTSRAKKGHVTNLEIKPSNLGGIPRGLGDWDDSQGSKNEHSMGETVSKGSSQDEKGSLSSTNEIPSVDNDIRITKLYLQKQGAQNMSVWSHLTNVLNKIVSERPENVIDYFEEYSRKVREEQLADTSLLKDVYVPLPHYENAKNVLSLLDVVGTKEEGEGEEPAVGEDEDEKEPATQMDLEEMGFYFKEAGIAVPDVQLFNINVAMKRLAEENSLLKPRFWGKILGTKQDYFILECELPEEEYQKRIEADEAEEAAEAERLAAEGEEQQEGEEGEGEEGEGEAPESLMEEAVKESVTSAMESVQSEEDGSGDSKHYMQKIYMNIEEKEKEAGEEEEDPLLPPLPPPKKLLTYKVPPILQPVTKEEIKVPYEKHGEGLNKKIYFVTNTPELDWTELPKVTPQQINVSQQIKAYFTGDLESKLVVYPAFPGDEKHYLRAQIARISASTQISPIGYYKFPGGGGEGEEEEEEVPEEEEEGGGGQNTVEENKKYKPIPVKDLIDPSFASWVHHSRYILKQGRADFWSTKKAGAGEEEAEEEQEEEEDEEKEAGGEEKETGPPLLTPLSEDAPLMDDIPAWSVRKTRSYNSNLAGAVVKSNLWPGAHAFAVGRKCENVYFGWGHKLDLHGFSPVSLPHPEYEYDLGPEIMEIQDPTVEVEQAWREAHRKKPPPAEAEEGEEEEGEGEEEEEEEDD